MKPAPPNRTSADGDIDFSRISALVVDDTPKSRELLSEVLRGLGAAKIDKAASGEAAMGFLRAGGVGIVFADIKASTQDGLDFIRKVRGSPDAAIAGVVVVMVSAQPTAERVMEAGVSGANSFLSKPYSVSALVRCVKEGFANRASSQDENRPKGPEPWIIDA
ncbi:two-component system response regulator [Phenylobacterium sp.]|uniref:response regulator n=1 Tax=Phenylobacterium sp. TaxID=1871053 RepID=UPI0035652798